MDQLSQIPQLVVSGITNGCVYAIVAIGFSIIYSSTQVINFAQGEFVMIGAMVAAVLLTKLSREPVYYGDLQDIDKKNREIKIIGDGACPPSLAGKLGPAGFAEHGIPTEGEAGGLSIHLVCKVGEGVLARLGRVDGRFTMVITRASMFEPPADQLERRKLECGIPFWPHGFVTAHGDIDAMLENWTNEYACLGYGPQLYADLVDFCKMTGIEAVLP